MVRQELCINSLVALSVALRSDIDRSSHTALIIGGKFHLGPFGRIAKNAFDVITQPHPAQLAACRTRRLARGKTGAVGGALGMGQNAGEIAHVIGLARGAGIGKPLNRDEIAPPQVPTINAQFPRGHIHGPFQHIDRLGAACTAIGIDLRCVGIVTLDMQIGGLHVIDPHQDL